MRNHGWFVFAGESTFPGFFGAGFVHPQYGKTSETKKTSSIRLVPVQIGPGERLHEAAPGLAEGLERPKGLAHLLKAARAAVPVLVFFGGGVGWGGLGGGFGWGGGGRFLRGGGGREVLVFVFGVVFLLYFLGGEGGGGILLDGSR